MKKSVLGFVAIVFLGLTACAGEDGEDGTNGKNGPDGENGMDGDDGLTSLIDVSPVRPGDNCEAGGQSISTGLDENGDGTLDEDEVESVNYVCNALDGDDGTNGVDGENGDSCSVTDNGDGTSTLSCTDGSSVTISDGMSGTDGSGVIATTAYSNATVNLGNNACVPYANLSLTLTVPTSGTIVLDGSLWMQLSHANGTEDLGVVGFSADAATCPDGTYMSAVQVPAEVATDTSYNVSVPVTAQVPVEAGTYTFYLVGSMQQGYDLNDNFWFANASAVFIPD